MKSFIEACTIAAFIAAACSSVHAEEKQDTRNYHNTIEQLMIMHTGEVSVGPSATYWSAREMPLYIQNGCTEDRFHVKQVCPY